MTIQSDEACMSTDELIDYTIKFWSPRYGREITREEAREMIANITAYAELLLKWSREENEAAKEARPEADSPAGANPAMGIVTNRPTAGSAALEAKPVRAKRTTRSRPRRASPA